MSDIILRLSLASEDIRNALITILDAGVDGKAAHELELIIDQVEELANGTCNAIGKIAKQRNQVIQMISEIEVDLDNPLDAPCNSKVGKLVDMLTEQISESLLLDLGGVLLDNHEDS